MEERDGTEVADSFRKPQIVICSNKGTHKLPIAGVLLILAVTPSVVMRLFQILVFKDYLHRNAYLLAKI